MKTEEHIRSATVLKDTIVDQTEGLPSSRALKLVLARLWAMSWHLAEEEDICSFQVTTLLGISEKSLDDGYYDDAREQMSQAAELLCGPYSPIPDRIRAL